MKMEALFQVWSQTCLGPASTPLSTHCAQATWLARSSCLPSFPFAFASQNNSIILLTLMLNEILQNMDGFYVSLCLFGLRSRETYRTADLTRSKTFEKPINKLFEELREKLNPWSVVWLRHCKTVSRKTRSDDITFSKDEAPIKNGYPTALYGSKYSLFVQKITVTNLHVFSLLYVYQM